MPNITKHTTRNWTGFQPPPKPEQHPLYQHNGTGYRIVPESDYRKLQSDKQGVVWMMVGAGAVIVAIGVQIAMWISSSATATPQPTIVEKPVIIEREKLVDRNCLAFCGGK